MPNPKKKQKKKLENPVLKVVKDISDDATKKIKKGIEDISKTVDDTIKNIQTDFEKQRIKKLKQDPAIKKLQKETIRKADKKAKKKLKQVTQIAEQAFEDAEKSRMVAERTRIESRDLKEKLEDIESKTKEIETFIIQLDDGFSKLKVDISKLKEENVYLFKKILTFEKKIREFIKKELKIIYNEQWWKEGIPLSIQERIEKFTHEQKINNKMMLLCFRDYLPIIVNEKNWKNIFWKIFPNKEYFETRINIIRNVRNSIAHANELNEDIEKLKTFLKDLKERISIA